MEETPSKEQLILLGNSLCEIQDKVMSVKGMPKHILQPIADKFEPLKAPMFFLWEKLGYGSPAELSLQGINGYWLASFNTSPQISFRSAYSNSTRMKSLSTNMTAALTYNARSSISIQNFKKYTKYDH